MKKSKNTEKSHIRTSFLVSFLLHLVVVVIFIFIKFESFSSDVPEYSTIEFYKAPDVTKPQTINKKKHQPTKEKSIEKIKVQEPIVSIDTLIERKDTFKIDSSRNTNPDQYLEFARTLLDTFLVRNPQYASMVLKQQAKALAHKKFDRETLIKRINDELHNYIRKYFPEGSEHAINPYTGPGLQIPIDDLINLVKKIFQ